MNKSKIAERYTAWASLPALTTNHFIARARAWALYCDARDNLPDGTTGVHKIESDEPTPQVKPLGRPRLAPRTTSYRWEAS